MPLPVIYLVRYKWTEFHVVKIIEIVYEPLYTLPSCFLSRTELLVFTAVMASKIKIVTIQYSQESGVDIDD